jgi:hypothetical protein
VRDAASPSEPALDLDDTLFGDDAFFEAEPELHRF